VTGVTSEGDKKKSALWPTFANDAKEDYPPRMPARRLHKNSRCTSSCRTHINLATDFSRDSGMCWRLCSVSDISMFSV
jgi:hypothetical protein